jgi:hypothetical protein
MVTLQTVQQDGCGCKKKEPKKNNSIPPMSQRRLMLFAFFGVLWLVFAL